MTSRGEKIEVTCPDCGRTRMVGWRGANDHRPRCKGCVQSEVNRQRKVDRLAKEAASVPTWC